MDWPVVKLGDVSELITKGTTPTSVGFKFTDSGINFIKIESITADGKFIPSKFAAISQECNESLKRSQLKEGDLLFSIAGALGRTAIVTKEILPANTNQALAIIRLKSDLQIDKQFLMFALTTGVTTDQVEKHRGGVAQQNLSLGQLKSFEIPLPPIAEQKRIVAILDQAFADIDKARALTEQNLKNARELFESYLQQVFSQRGEGWVEKGLNEVSLDFGRGKSKHRPRNDESLYGGEYPFIQTGDVRNSEHRITTYSKTYNEKGLAQSKLWPKDTICITIAANIAETGIMDFEGCFPDSVIGIVVDPKETSVRYVEYLLQSFRAFLQSKGQGSAQDNINLGTFENLKFPFPALDEQEKVVDSLDTLMVSVQSLEKIYAQKLSSIDELKRSLLQKAFSGALTKDTEEAAA